ncbi:MAG TPA: hypothetical protein VHI13_20295 [Candidatus Kapabacteria bacterium]|nr:hypothetical protein [Candidatus Kapabacteria bacterium]
MKNVVVSLFLLATLNTIVSAQNRVYLPDASATLIGTFPVQVGFINDGTGTPILAKNQRPTHTVITVVGSFRTSTGSVSYQIMSDSTRFCGENGTLVDAATTKTIYAWLSDAAINQGVLLGYTPAPTTGSLNVTVVADPNVLRCNSGLTTLFHPCYQGDFSVWPYAVSLGSTGLAVVQPLSPGQHIGPQVSGYEPTADDYSGSAYQIY